MRARGRKHSPGERLLLKQVAEVFQEKKRELGAKGAAQELNVCLASFYNYAAGTDLPRMEVLRDAQEKWGIKWKLIDPAEILRTQKMQSPEQIVFSFLKALREEDVEVARIKPEGQSLLSVTFKIRFPA